MDNAFENSYFENEWVDNDKAILYSDYVTGFGDSVPTLSLDLEANQPDSNCYNRDATLTQYSHISSVDANQIAYLDTGSPPRQIPEIGEERGSSDLDEIKAM